MPAHPSLVWLRRDLRLHDHAALHTALQAREPVQPVFIFDPEILARFGNPKDRRLSFLARTLFALHEALRGHGGGLLVLHGRAREAIPALAAALKAAGVVCAADYEPQTRARDEAVRAALGAAGMAWQAVTDHVIFPPGAVLKEDGTPYRVFTPFSKRWRACLNQHSYAQQSVALQGRLADYPSVCKAADAAGLSRLRVQDGAAAMLEAVGYSLVDEPEWPVHDAPARLHHVIENRLDAYHETGDRLDMDGTSRLSPYLRFGLISVRACFRLAAERPGRGSDTWQTELIWREFYQHILSYFPDSASEEFQDACRGLPWRQDAQTLAAWQEGRTGYPIVDAAMRQLRDMGWMHNRARMIVASFLTKDLHLDWRLGEEHFAQYLMDYDLASNVGGWQWAASTGTDAQPYFRIFNPERQSRRFDPEGAYIRRFVPELRDVQGDAIHAPHKAKDLFRPPDYPEPIVDHHVEKDKAVAMFKKTAN